MTDALLVRLCEGVAVVDRPMVVSSGDRFDSRPCSPAFEPGLVAALATLSPRQRAAVVLVHGFGYGVTEAAGTLRCRPSTVRNHLDRGLARLRRHLGTDDTGATDG